MIALIQRVAEASVAVGGATIAAIGPGILAFAALDADERQDAGAGRADGFAADGDARLGDALDERYHVNVILNLRR